MPVSFPHSSEFRGFDLGRAVGDAETIKGARLRNQLLGHQVDEYQNVLKNRERAREIREQIEGMPAQIAAMEEQGLYEQAGQLRNSYIDTRLNEVNILEAMRDRIDGKNYDQFRQDMLEAGAMEDYMLPDEYSDEWFRDSMDDTKRKLQVLTRRWGEEGATFSQDFIQDGTGRISWTGEPFETEASRREARLTDEAGGGGAPKRSEQTSASNAIARAAAEVYGGFYDPITGRYSGLDDKTQEKVLSLAAEGERVWQSTGLGPRQALAQAARTQGIEIVDLSPTGSDPLGLNP